MIFLSLFFFSDGLFLILEWLSSLDDERSHLFIMYLFIYFGETFYEEYNSLLFCFPSFVYLLLSWISFLSDFSFFWVEFKSPVLASLAALSFLEKVKCHFFLLFIIIVSFAKSACSMMSRVLGFILWFYWDASNTFSFCTFLFYGQSVWKCRAFVLLLELFHFLGLN